MAHEAPDSAGDAADRPLHVCFVLPRGEYYSSATGGAITTVTHELTRELLASHQAVTILAPDDGGPTYDEGEVVRLRFPDHHLGVRAAGAVRWRLARLTRSDLESLDSYRVAVLLALRNVKGADGVVVANDSGLARDVERSGFPTVLWLHNQLSQHEARYLPTLSSDVRIVAVSDSVRRWTAAEYGISPDRITVAHNGVDLDQFRPHPRAQRPDGPLRVVCHGRIDPNKGFDIAAAAVADARSRGVPVELTVVGKVKAFGLAPEDLAAYQERLELVLKDAGATVIDHLPHDEIPALLSDHDVACHLPRTADPFPLAALEAMAAGCAMVVHPTGGLTEMVGEAAERVGPEASSEVADLLERFAHDPELLTQRQAAARKQAETFTWAVPAGILHGLLADSPPSGTDIVFVNNSRETFTPTASGAIATCIREVCLAAAETGIEPTVLTRRAPGVEAYPWNNVLFLPAASRFPMERYRLIRGVRRLSGWARADQWLYARQVRSALRRMKPRVIVCNNDPEVAVYLAEEFPDTLVVHWFHNLELTSPRFLRKFHKVQITPVAVSHYLARALERYYPYPARSIPAVLNGVDSERFTPRERADDDSSPVTIGFLGRVAIEKAPDTLLRACIQLAATRKDFAVQLIGDTNWGRSEPGPYRSEVQDLVDELRALGIVVTTHGHLSREDTAAATRQADIQVIPSRWDEPFGLVASEGMASGLAVVASASGGMPEVLRDAGLLFPRDDAAALAEVLNRLLDDPESRAKLQRLARQRAVTDLTWSATWRGLRDVWEQ